MVATGGSQVGSLLVLLTRIWRTWCGNGFARIFHLSMTAGLLVSTDHSDSTSEQLSLTLRRSSLA